MAELKSLCQRLAIDECVHFAGAVPHEQLPVYFAQSSLFVLPSFSEGFSLVVSEALACETPAVVSKLPIFETLTGNQNILKYCLPGKPDSIAEAIIEELKNTRRVPEGREWVCQNLSQNKVAQRYLEFYSE